ncbi:MAG TPA: hypothetical protein VH796_13535 [Nitrososphaeraceae archaeon]
MLSYAISQRVSPTETIFYLLGMQGVPPTVFKELHNVIPNPVAKAWVVKLVEIKINPSAVTIARVVKNIFVFINNI